MYVWYHLSTIINRRRVLQIAGIFTLCVALITMLFLSVVAKAAPGVNQTISVQARLLNSAGSTVPDGFYNIQFKIYEGGTGTAAGNPDGTLKWTETYTNNGASTGVRVSNGYMTVNLGSVTPFGESVDWNQNTLWLSMNIAGLASNCSTFGTGLCVADGEMVPMKRLTASPYALNAGRLNGIDSDGFIKNSTTSQTGSFNISGTGRADVIQGNSTVITPSLESNANGTLSIGAQNPSTIAIGTSDNKDQNIQIGRANGNKTVSIGTTSGTSSLSLQAGTNGISLESNGGIGFRSTGIGYDQFHLYGNGGASMRLGSGSEYNIHNNDNGLILGLTNGGIITAADGTHLQVNGTATFTNGLTIQGTGSLRYRTPGGYDMNTAINIPNYTVGQYSSILAFGLPSSSDATARGILIADARTGAHQATIGVLSPDENNIMGFSWNGSTSTGYISNTANSLALQGNGLNLLTATNSGGQANVGIGNTASAGHALDVTGDTNTSGQYRIGGTTTLTNSALSFSGPTTSGITSANGQSLNVDGKNGITLQFGGTTKASLTSANLKIGTNSGATTLLTLDTASSAPTGILGSMYYDSTIGKVQCFEADGWGSCSSSPDTYVTLNPEYANSVTNGPGNGTLTSDFCSDALNINDGSPGQEQVCGTNQTMNFYNWSTGQASSQEKSIYVTYQLPANFKRFVSNTTSLMAARAPGGSTVDYQVYKSNASGLTACGTALSAGTAGTWNQLDATGSADPANCLFAAGDSIVFKIKMTAIADSPAGVSTLKFAYNDD